MWVYFVTDIAMHFFLSSLDVCSYDPVSGIELDGTSFVFVRIFIVGHVYAKRAKPPNSSISGYK